MLTLGENAIIEWFENRDAIWLHDGDPQKPHAELTSGKCSDGFINCGKVLCYPEDCHMFANFLLGKLERATGIGLNNVTHVIGSSYAAITLSYEIARILRAIHAFTEKDPDDSKRQVWRRMTIPANAVVLHIEELITTSQTFKAVREGVLAGNASPVTFLPIIGTLVHRPPKLPVSYGDDIEIVSLLEKEIHAFDQADCPLCAQGSKPLRPKTHWKELMGKS